METAVALHPAESAPARRARLGRRWNVERVTTAVVIAGLIWRVARYLANWPLWGDEAYLAVNLLVRDFAGLGRPLEYHQIAPVGFLWAERVAYLALGAGEWALRLLPFAAGVASLLMFRRLAATTLGPRGALVATAIFAASFFPIRHATEVKPYATDLFVSIGLTMLAARVRRSPGSTPSWVALATAAAVGVWVSYPAIFVAGGLGIVLGVDALIGRRGWRSLFPPVAFGVATLASWGLFYVGYARPQAVAAPFYENMPTWEGAFPPVERPWEIPRWLIEVHAGNLAAYPYGGNHFGSVGTAIFAAIGAWVLLVRDRRTLALLLAPIGPALLAAALHRYPYGTSARIALYLAPATCLLAGQGLAAAFLVRLPRWLARRTIFGSVAVLGVTAIVGAVVSFAMPYKAAEDLGPRRLVRELADRSSPGDRWIGYNGLMTLPESDRLMLMPWLQHAAQLQFYALRDLPGPLAWNPPAESVAPSRTGRTWLLAESFTRVDRPIDRLQDYFLRLGVRGVPPTIEQFRPSPWETIRVFLYPAPSGASSPEE